jgi:hypothetical protein
VALRETLNGLGCIQSSTQRLRNAYEDLEQSVTCS